jgi:tRNA-2-methylthio-N6-dimethylallyladenosine synthase
VPDAEKVRRLGALQALLNEQQAAFNAAQIGRDLVVLLEKKGRKTGQIAGRSPYLQAVHVNADEDMVGHVVLVRIQEAGPNSLSGVIISHIDSSRVNKQNPESQNTGML